MDTRLTIQGTGMTDVGKKRTGNEDTYYCGTIWDERYMLALVVDGCGGYKGGAEAARITRDSMLEYLETNPSGDRLSLLKSALVYANNKVYDARNAEDGLEEMCCVATAVLLDAEQERMVMVHVGDTRLYASIEGRIIKLSHDHSPVGRYEEEGVLSESEAMSHPDRNVIERAVGVDFLDEDTTYIEQVEFPITSGLTFLLCSDGLCDMVSSAVMNDILGSDADLQQKVASLVDAANDAGGKDNITVVVLHTDGKDGTQAWDMMNRYSTIMNPDRKPDNSNSLKNFTMKSISGHSDGEMDDDSEPDTESEAGQVEPFDTESATAQLPDKEKPLETAQDITETASNDTEETGTGGPSFEQEQKDIEEEVPDNSTVNADKSSPRKRKFLFIIVWLLLATGVVAGVVAYRGYQDKLIEQRNESIRERIRVRNLYYNVYNLNRGNQVNTLTDSIN